MQNKFSAAYLSNTYIPYIPQTYVANNKHTYTLKIHRRAEFYS